MKRFAVALAIACISLAAPAVAQAGAVTDQAAPVGVAQSDQSFDTMVFDYNSDGVQDFLYSPQNDPAGRQLWQGNSDGTFTLVTHLVGMLTTDQHGCTHADYDRNGLEDVYCTMGTVHASRTKVNPLWLQTSPGTFTLSSTGGGAADTAGRGYSTSTADFNNDGLPDLFVDNFYPRPDGQPTPDRVYLNLGTDPVTGAWLGFADDTASGLEVEQGNRGCDFTTDFNNDGFADIIFCGVGHVQFYAGDGAGHFTERSAALGLVGFGAADVKLADVNSDGVRDLVYVRLGQEGVRLGKLAGGYGPPVQTHPMTAGRMVEVVDMNADGKPDIYVLQGNGAPGCTTCNTNYPDVLYLGDGAGHWTTTPIPQATAGSGDTVDAISLPVGTGLIVGNGANLFKGPLMILESTGGALR